MDKKKISFWLPRGLIILYIVLMIAFSSRAFMADLPLTQKIIGFFAGNIPSFVLIAIVLATWKKSFSASISLFITLLLFVVIFGLYKNILSFMLVVTPLAFSGILYLSDHLYNEEIRPPEPGLLDEDED